MLRRISTLFCVGVSAIFLLCAAFTSHAQQANRSTTARATSKAQIKAEDRVSVEVARERATLMHKIYESTLHAMHRHYFRKEQATLPARALEDVFSEVMNDTKAEARWIAVNTRAMSIDHEPETEFENQAVKAISKGNDQVELVEGGYYRRATVISLSGGCLNCHNIGPLAPPPKSPRYAGLVISIPVKDE